MNPENRITLELAVTPVLAELLRTTQPMLADLLSVILGKARSESSQPKKPSRRRVKNRGRGGLLSCGDVEKNPGPDKSAKPKKTMNVTANNVNVRPRRQRRRRRGRSRSRSRSRPRPIRSVTFTNSNEEEGAGSLVPVGGGRVTVDDICHQVEGECVDPSEGAIGWYYKYMDPAGAVESGKALGEFTKVPDGLLRYSVDAEQRPIVVEECPLNSNSTLPLDGELWSVSFISFPCFRLNYVAVASTVNEELTTDVINELLSTLNNIVDWRAKAEADWILFSGTTWFYRIRTLPNTFAMAESDGRTDGVTQFRKSYKGITFEFNSPTLIDQGWWVGGHIPVKPRNLTEPEGEELKSSLRVVLISTSPAAGTVTFRFDIAGLTSFSNIAIVGGGAVLPSEGASLDVVAVGVPLEAVVSFQVGTGITIDDATFANVGDTVSIAFIDYVSDTRARFQLTSSYPGSAVIVLETAFGVYFVQELYLEFPAPSFNDLSVEVPALTTAELTTNNPKIEQFLCKESGGAYIVHYKMNNPVFEMTGEENFGFFKFSYPGYNSSNNAVGPRGIQDAFENNFSSAVVHFRGISKASTIVSKTYDGWEGTTNAASTVGQFAHAGAQEEVEVVDLANRIQAEMTGVYQADDNFAALVSMLASTALGGLLKSTATPSIIKSLAQKAVGAVTANPEVVSESVSAIGGIGARLMNSIKSRRAKRRLRSS